MLSTGPILMKEVLRQAKEAGVSERTLKRAKANLSVRSDRLHQPGASAHWTWRLSQGCQENGKSAKDAKNTVLEKVGTLAGTLASEPLEMEDEPL